MTPSSPPDPPPEAAPDLPEEGPAPFWSRAFLVSAPFLFLLLFFLLDRLLRR